MDLALFISLLLYDVSQCSEDLVVMPSISPLEQSCTQPVCVPSFLFPHIAYTVDPPSFPSCAGLLVLEGYHTLRSRKEAPVSRVSPFLLSLSDLSLDRVTPLPWVCFPPLLKVGVSESLSPNAQVADDVLHLQQASCLCH